MSYRSDILKQLDQQIPVSTRKLLRKNKVYYENRKPWLTNEAFDFIKLLWSLRDEGLIEHVWYSGWILAGKND